MDKRKVAYLIIGFTGTFAFVMFLIFITKTSPIDSNLPIDTNIFSNYGGIVGGISAALLSLASVLLIIQSIDNQENQRKLDKSENLQQQKLNDIENRFFELIKIHRANTSEFQSKGFKGRAVIVNIFDEFDDLYKNIKLHYTYELSGLHNEQEYRKRIGQIAYYITYFGLGNNSTKKLNEIIKEIIGVDFFDRVFYPNYLEPKTINQQKIKESNNEKPLKKRKYLENDGHQSRLGHYFRHLFQTTKYINNQSNELLNYQKKYEYIKTLRAQLSNFEQALLFINSLTDFGAPWELSETNKDKKLLTKYNFIKNLTPDLIDDLNPKDYFPDVYYEFDNDKTDNRKQLESTYS